MEVALLVCRLIGITGLAVNVSIMEAGMLPMVTAGAMAAIAGMVSLEGMEQDAGVGHFGRRLGYRWVIFACRFTIISGKEVLKVTRPFTRLSPKGHFSMHFAGL